MKELTLDQIKKRWEDIQTLHKTGSWPNRQVPAWVDNILRDHYCDKDLSEIGCGPVTGACLEELVPLLIEMVEDCEQKS